MSIENSIPGKERLKLIRKLLGIKTQQQLADFIELPMYKIRDAEAGKTKVSAEIAKAIERKTDFCFDWITTGIGNMRTSGGIVQQVGPTEGHKGDALVMHVTGGSVHVDTAAHVDKTHNGNHQAPPITEEEHETQNYIATTVDSLSFIKSVVAIMWDMPKDKQKKALRRVFDVDEEI